jgi:hypothetical protein
MIQVVSVENIGKRDRVVLGDETGVVRAFLWNNPVLKVGSTVVLFKAESPVIKEHIEVQLMERGKVDEARREVRDVNKTNDISAKEWVEQA